MAVGAISYRYRRVFRDLPAPSRGVGALDRAHDALIEFVASPIHASTPSQNSGSRDAVSQFEIQLQRLRQDP